MNYPKIKITMDRTSLYHSLDEYAQDSVNDAVVYCFYVRDHVNGMGLRDTGRLAFNWIADRHPLLFVRVMALIPVYGRWDDLLYIKSRDVQFFVFQCISCQIAKDQLNMMCGKPISNCAKWLPSEGKSFARNNKETFTRLVTYLKHTPKSYRILLGTLRQYLDIPEIKLCNGSVRSINFDKLTNKARAKYNALLSLKDEWRYAAWKKKRYANPQQKLGMNTYAKPTEVYNTVTNVLGLSA